MGVALPDANISSFFLFLENSTNSLWGWTRTFHCEVRVCVCFHNQYPCQFWYLLYVALLPAFAWRRRDLATLASVDMLKRQKRWSQREEKEGETASIMDRLNLYDTQKKREREKVCFLVVASISFSFFPSFSLCHRVPSLSLSFSLSLSLSRRLTPGRITWWRTDGGNLCSSVCIAESMK